MVNVAKGVLVECDPAMKQFLLHMDETLALGTKFVVQDLDERHLFVTPDAVDRIKEKIDDLMDAVSVPVVDGGSGGEGQKKHRR